VAVAVVGVDILSLCARRISTNDGVGASWCRQKRRDRGEHTHEKEKGGELSLGGFPGAGPSD
jgi:hypothetical protein